MKMKVVSDCVIDKIAVWILTGHSPKDSTNHNLNPIINQQFYTTRLINQSHQLTKPYLMIFFQQISTHPIPNLNLSIVNLPLRLTYPIYKTSQPNLIT